MLGPQCFPQEDYKELCQLLILWMGGVVPGFDQENKYPVFQYPGPIHYARFMACADILQVR